MLVEAAFTVLLSRPSPVLGVSVLISVYTVACTARRRVADIAALVTAAALYAVVVHSMGLASRAEGAGVFASAGVCAAVGGTVRTWRDYLAAIEERAVQAEASKEEARRRVTEERLRIARKLHDVLAHHIALITLQAGVARNLLRSEPDQADTVLGHIRDAGRDVPLPGRHHRQPLRRCSQGVSKSPVRADAGVGAAAPDRWQRLGPGRSRAGIVC